jgi:hypothetical protein
MPPFPEPRDYLPTMFVVGDEFVFRGLPTSSGAPGCGEYVLAITGVTMTGDLLIKADDKIGSVSLDVARLLVQERIWTRKRT